MSYQKFMLRQANALAVAGVAASLTLEDRFRKKIREGRVALTAVAPTPLIAQEASRHLAGKPPSKATFEEAARIARQEARPITDIRGTGEYRARLVEVLTARALDEALTRAWVEDQ
jgi:carbon-monoxide dehydrogenase medium subunit